MKETIEEIKKALNQFVSNIEKKINTVYRPLIMQFILMLKTRMDIMLEKIAARSKVFWEKFVKLMSPIINLWNKLLYLGKTFCIKCLFPFISKIFKFIYPYFKKLCIFIYKHILVNLYKTIKFLWEKVVVKVFKLLEYLYQKIEKIFILAYQKTKVFWDILERVITYLAKKLWIVLNKVFFQISRFIEFCWNVTFEVLAFFKNAIINNLARFVRDSFYVTVGFPIYIYQKIKGKG